MNQGQSSKRSRGHRGNSRRQSGGRNFNFESSGPQGKIRGTASQVIEKYQSLGRDALTFGDRVAAENYFQHAEHYYRVMVANGGSDQRGGRNAGSSSNKNGQAQGQQHSKNAAAANNQSEVSDVANIEAAEVGVSESLPNGSSEPTKEVENLSIESEGENNETPADNNELGS